VPKKYSSTKESMKVKETSGEKITEGEPRFATPKMLQNALAHVMKVHGTALQKLAK
jgi:hypothetical protein